MTMMLRGLMFLFTLFSHTALYADQDTQLSGFGTLGVSWFSNPHTDFQYNQITRGPGRSMTFDAGLDSNLGLQLDHRWNDRFSMAVQAISFHTGEDNFVPSVSLAFVRVNMTKELSVRLGRFQNPAFLYSDSRNIHFDQPGVRPTKIVYGLSPHFQLDGAEFSYKTPLGSWDSDLQLGIGSNDFTTTIGRMGIKSNHIRWTLDRFPWTLSTTYSRVTSNLDSPSLNSAFSTLGLFEDKQSVQQLTLINKELDFFTLSARYDDNQWLLLSEYGKLDTPSFLGKHEAMYFTLGKYFGSTLVFTSFAQRWADTFRIETHAPISTYIMNELAKSADYDSKMFTLGARHELGNNMRFKYQADIIVPDKNVLGPYTNHAPSYDFSNPDTDLLLSMSLDFIF